MKSVNKFNFYLAIFIGMFDLTIFSTGNSLGQALTTVLLLFSILSDINKVFLKPFFFVISYIVLALLVSLFHGETSYHYSFIIVKTGLILFNAMVISQILILYADKKQISNFVNFIFLIQTISLLLYSNELFQMMRGFFLSARSEHLYENFGDSYWYRDATISNQGYSGYALGALPLVIIAVHNIMKSKFFSIRYFVAVVCCGLGVSIAMLNGRSVFLFIPLYMIYLMLRPKEICLIYKIIPVILIIVSAIIIALTNFDISSNFVLAFFEQKGKSYGIDSVDDLMYNHTILHFDITLFGLGKYLLSDGSAFVRSDIGYYRQMGVGGISLVLFYIFSIWLAVRYVIYRDLSLFILFIILLVNFKQEAFNNAMLMYGAFLLAAYWVARDKIEITKK